MIKCLLILFCFILTLLNYLNSNRNKTVRDEKTRNVYVFKRLKMISQIDSIKKPPLKIRNKEIECNLPEPSKFEQKGNLLENRPQMDDIKKRFQIWSQNMKDYDRVRSSLINMA